MAFTKITASGIGSTETVTLDGLSVINDGSFGGNVSVGGTLTYEDVTNIDSVGLITARAGVVVGSGITLSVDGDGFFTGVVTATTFKGDGSQLSNVTSTTINNNADNRLITGSGTANTLEGESTLTYGGTELLISNASPSVKLNDTDNSGVVDINNVGGVAVVQSTGDTVFETNSSERLRINSSGRITTPLGTSNRIGISDRTSGTGAGGSLLVTAGAARGSSQTTGNLLLAAGRGNNSADNGEIRFGYNDGADGTGLDGEHARIDNNGNLGIGTDAPAQAVHINKSSGDSYLRIQGGTNQGTLINKTDGTLIGGFVSGGAVGASVNDIAVRTETGNNIVFAHGTTERLRVTSGGYLQQHKLIAVSYSDTREIELSNTELTTSNFYNYTNFASDPNILDSNGHFVAPVHGIYRLYFRCTTDGDAGNRANVRLRKNGTTVNEAYANSSSSSNNMSVSSEIIAELDANEYLDIQVAQLHTMPGAQHKVVNFHMLG